MTATMLLRRDHEAVAGLFRDFERIDEHDATARREAFERLRTALEVHARIEEELFYAELRKVGEVADAVADALRDHERVRDLLAEIGGMSPQDDDYIGKVEVLRENVDQHVEEEESEIFPLAKKHLSPQRLEEMGMALEARRQELYEQHRRAAVV